MGHVGHLMPGNGNCQKFDDADVDMLNSIYSVSAKMLTSRVEEEQIQIYEMSCIGYYIAGCVR